LFNRLAKKEGTEMATANNNSSSQGASVNQNTQARPTARSMFKTILLAGSSVALVGAGVYCMNRAYDTDPRIANKIRRMFR
jgi:hypothetical protein